LQSGLSQPGGHQIPAAQQNENCCLPARDLLAPIYNWFTEGFDAPDLKDAKALLDELA
jgi:hypothetical protein